MRTSFLCLLIAAVSSLFYSCENRYRNRGQSVSAQQGIETLERTSSKRAQQEGLSKDAYQVTASEFDEFFTYRYGLLYQKFSDIPFSGRVVTADKGDKGSFVSLDEGWRDGKKDGVSTRWFSNGVKMYERNYSGGKWHGTVTRWWPNGQKMYVRAYTDGKRHGKEATWRSDGTPINLSTRDSSKSSINSVVSEDPSDQDNDLPSVSIPEATNLLEPRAVVEAPNSFAPVDSEPSFDPIGLPSAPAAETEMTDSFPAFEPVVDPATTTDAPSEPQPEPSSGLPPLPEPAELSDNDLPSSSADTFVEPAFQAVMPGNELGGDELPSLPVTEEVPPSDDLPPLSGGSVPDPGGLPPLTDGASGGLPPLPAAGGLPPLPDDGGLPPLPGDGGLPPLPGDDGLPPLPPLP